MSRDQKLGDWMRTIAKIADAAAGAAEKGAKLGDKVDEAKVKLKRQKCVTPGCDNPAARKSNGEPWLFCKDCFAKSARGAIDGALGPIFGKLFGDDEPEEKPPVVVVEVKDTKSR